MDSVKAYFDSVAPGYDERSRTGLWRILRRREARSIFNMTSGGRGKALDLGCGSGFYAKRLKQAGYQDVTCVDFSAEMLKTVDCECDKVLCDIGSFGSEQKYDFVLCAGSLEFVSDPSMVFFRVAKILADAGTFVILVPRKSALSFLYAFFHQRHGIQVHLFTLSEIRSMSESAGLELVAWKKLFPFSAVIKIVRKHWVESAER